ncbi:restriction endonuclease subunit S [Gallibacterium melopsittaci]|uniref:Restriction endonuclease subunit S n=1 Tax=Gallibacterium melopsittaci TaxID=516063 RepID=A0ABV6HUS9_9PAST
MKLTDCINIHNGTPLFRITEDNNAPSFYLYSQNDLQADLAMTSTCETENKIIRTTNKVSCLKPNDIVFSLISGTAAKVHPARSGYLYSHNYVVLEPNEMIDANFLVYFLNCSQEIKKKFALSIQGSQVMKYTISQLRQLEINALPDLPTQRAVGKIYMAQNRLITLKKRLIEQDNQHLLYIIDTLLNAKGQC